MFKLGQLNFTSVALPLSLETAEKVYFPMVQFFLSDL